MDHSVTVLHNPPANLATLGSALNLAVLLEMHRTSLQEGGKREVGRHPLLFTKMTALMIHLADRHVRGGASVSWQLACELLLPVEAIEVRFNVQTPIGAPAPMDPAEVRRLLHPSAVPRAALPTGSTDSRTVTIPYEAASEHSLPVLLSRHDEECQRRFRFDYSLIAPLDPKFRHGHIYLDASELHVIFLDLMHDIAYKRDPEERKVAFFGLYLFGHLYESHQGSLHNLYLSLPSSGVGPNGTEKTKTWFRAVKMVAGSTPEAHMHFYKKQRDWHLSLESQGGSGGQRDPEKLLKQYKKFFEDALYVLEKAIEGASRESSASPSPAFSLSKSAYHPVARRLYM